MKHLSATALIGCAAFSAALLPAGCLSRARAADAPPAIAQDINAVGSDQLGPLMHRLQSVLDQQSHAPHIHADLRGSSVALNALADGVADIAPLGRIAWPEEMEVFKAIKGRMAVAFRIGYAGFGPNPDSKMPPAIYINAKNSISGMTFADAARAITTGQMDGDIDIWGQAGAAGFLAGRRIHIYGARDDGRTITAIRLAYFAHHPFKPDYEGFPTDEAALEALSGDEAGIALAGWLDPKKIPKSVRVLPLSALAGRPAALPDRAGVQSGAYPIRQYLELYVDPGATKTRYQAILSLVEAALSDAGQRAIPGSDPDSMGFLPLSAEELSQQRALLRKMIAQSPR